ncbi:unnamed protein product, partial [Rotaria sp. Silwood1]
MSTTNIPDSHRHIANTVSQKDKVSSKNVPICNSTSILDNNNSNKENLIF